MQKFTYIAADANHQPINGTIEALDRASVITALTKQNLRPLSIREGSGKPKIALDNLFDFGTKKVKPDQLVIMTRELSAMVGAGVPLLRALTSLSSHSNSPAIKSILAGVIRDVQGGSTLGDALAKYPDSFDEVYVNMVRAGEAAGILDDILKRLAAQQEKSTTIRKKIRGAMAYPAVLLSIVVLAFFGLMLFVVPQIGNIFKSLGGPGTQLPGITLVMLSISNFVVHFWWILIPGIAVLIFGISRYIKTRRGRLLLDTVALKIPGIGGIVRKIAVSRFARVFSAMMGAGVDVLQCLEVTSRAVGNVLFEQALKDAAKEIISGKSLSSVLESNDLFPAIVPQMLAVGEETGQTDSVLIKVADFYDEEVDVAINSLSAIIEPVLIIILGATVGLIAASVMVPIASLSSAVH